MDIPASVRREIDAVGLALTNLSAREAPIYGAPAFAARAQEQSSSDAGRRAA